MSLDPSPCAEQQQYHSTAFKTKISTIDADSEVEQMIAQNEFVSLRFANLENLSRFAICLICGLRHW